MIEATLIDTTQFTKSIFGWYNYEPEVGHVIERWHPFTLFVDRYPVHWDCNEQPMKMHEDKRWRPGAWDSRSGYESEWQAYHEEGKCRLQVHAIAQPKGFPRRIMYTRQFITPEGREYKRSGLLCHSIGKFRKVCAGPKCGGHKVDDYEPISQEYRL